MGIVKSFYNSELASRLAIPVSLVLAGFYVFATYGVVKKDWTKQAIASELIPYIEMVDGYQGISHQDKLDFARRAGLTEDQTQQLNGKNVYGMDVFNLSNYSTE